MKFTEDISERVKYFYGVAQEWMKAGVGTDVSICCGVSPYKTVFYCHRFMIRTFLLQQCGQHDMADVDQIIFPETDPNLFLKYLNFIYGFQTNENDIIFDKNMENSIEDILSFANSYVKVKLENEQITSDDEEDFKEEFRHKTGVAHVYQEPLEVNHPDFVPKPQKVYKCSFCGKEFSRSDHLNRHIVTHTGQKQFQCDLCGKEFARKDKLKLHKSSAHNTAEEQKHFCSCGKEFINEYDFYDHKQENPEHRKVENFQNSIKQESTDDPTQFQYSLNSNFREIDGKKLVFKVRNKIKGKKKLKKKKSSYPCKYCDTVFQYAKERKTHSLEVHWSELKERGLIFNHNNTVNIKNFHCDFENCDRAFRHRCEKNDHIAAVHRGEKNYVCEICSKAFPYRKSLKIHMELKHNDGPAENILCTHCGGVFPSKLKLQIHIDCAHKVKVKKFLCKFCDFKTHAKNVITEHERTHTGEKPEICAWCGKGFNAKKTLKNHERLHTGEKPYKCLYCDNGFAQRTSLNVHMQSHHKDILASQSGPLKTKNFSPIKPDPGEDDNDQRGNLKTLLSSNLPPSPTSPTGQPSQTENGHSPSVERPRHSSGYDQQRFNVNPPPPLHSQMYDYQRHQFDFEHFRQQSVANYEQQLQQLQRQHSQINQLSQMSPGYHSSDPRLRYEPHQESSP